MIDRHRLARWRRKFKREIEALSLFIIYYILMEFIIKPAIARVDVLVRIYNYGANEEILWVALLFLFGYSYFIVKRRVLKSSEE